MFYLEKLCWTLTLSKIIATRFWCYILCDQEKAGLVYTFKGEILRNQLINKNVRPLKYHPLLHETAKGFSGFGTIVFHHPLHQLSDLIGQVFAQNAEPGKPTPFRFMSHDFYTNMCEHPDLRSWSHLKTKTLVICRLIICVPSRNYYYTRIVCQFVADEYLGSMLLLATLVSLLWIQGELFTSPRIYLTHFHENSASTDTWQPYVFQTLGADYSQQLNNFIGQYPFKQQQNIYRQIQENLGALQNQLQQQNFQLSSYLQGIFATKAEGNHGDNMWGGGPIGIYNSNEVPNGNVPNNYGGAQMQANDHVENYNHVTNDGHGHVDDKGKVIVLLSQDEIRKWVPQEEDILLVL